ncbi:MAG: fungal-specific transcription factor domain-containing protein [Benjaminiella poitrasii]|nr:MAG: fungal-specific transcription factor domain-containing protein [Benjaminiella poitrasii]
MIEEPPPLPFPSLQNLKTPASEILKLQRNPTTPDVEFRFFEPEPKHSTQLEKRRQRPNNKACEVCKKKKIRCDINAFPNEKCTRTNCQCLYHEKKEIKQEEDDTAAIIETCPFSNENASLSNSQQFNLNNYVPSTTAFRKPGLLNSCHYTGETSFCGYLPAEDQPPVITQESDFPDFQPAPKEPNISRADQHYLIDVYYDNMNPFYPILNKQDLLNQLECVVKKQDSYLSPLFFYALFARAAHVEMNRKVTSDNKQSFEELGVECTNYVSALVDCYKDKPRISTVMALIIMINHLEQAKLYQYITRCWLWTGEAFRMALDLGIHRAFISDENSPFGQLCIRTFWLAYIIDCTISMTYGRPSSTEEKVLDVTYPTKLPSDDNVLAQWISELNSLISLSKVTSRVIKFNYCPPPPYIIQGPVKRHNAFLVSVDSWLIDIMHPLKEPESPMSNSSNYIAEETVASRRMKFQKQLFLYINLILLHRPYVNDALSVRNTSSRPSYDICSYAAIIITDSVSKLDYNELIYHSQLPLIAYSLVISLRVHIMNAANSNPDKYNANRNFHLGLSTLSKLPQTQHANSMLHDTLIDLQKQYNNRFALLDNAEDSKVQKLQIQQNIITADQLVFNPNAVEKRKDKFSNDKSTIHVGTTTAGTISTNVGPSIVIKEHQIDNSGRKKKKVKMTGQPTNQQHQQQKQRQKYKHKHQKSLEIQQQNSLDSPSNKQDAPPTFQNASNPFLSVHDKYNEKFIKDQIVQLFEEPKTTKPLQQQNQIGSQPYRFQYHHPLEQYNTTLANTHMNPIPINSRISSDFSSLFSQFESPLFLQPSPFVYSNNSSSPVTQNSSITSTAQTLQHHNMFSSEDNDQGFDLTLDQIQSNPVSFFQDINNLFTDHPQAFLINQQSNLPDDTFAIYNVEAQENAMGITIIKSSSNNNSQTAQHSSSSTDFNFNSSTL